MTNEQLTARYAKVMHEIERCVYDVRSYVPESLSNTRFSLETEMVRRGLMSEDAPYAPF